MKKSTKRVVGWGSGVAIGLCLVLLTFILILSVDGTPQGSLEDKMKLDLVESDHGER